MSNITEKDIKLFYEMLERDKNSAHFLWDCAAGTVVSAGSGIFADVSGDPLEYLRESGLIDPQSLPSFNIFSSCIEEGTISGSDRMSLSADIRMKLSADGEIRLCGFYAHFLKDDGGRIIAVHGTIRPYTSRELFDRRVLSGFSSDRDPRIFSDEAAEMIKRHPNEEIAFIQFDVERFKLINEKYGVEAGDELLEFLYGTLGLICSEEQPFARLNADVFMVVTTFSSDSDLRGFIHRIESMLTGFQNMEYRLIFGVAIVEDRSLHIRRHGDNAALARQSIKGNALNNIGFFNGRMKSELHKKQSIEDDMMNALLDGQFVMYLQPKFSISTKRIIGAEALARWIHPEKGMISPADFVPVFEENGFILKLDQIIWESACRKIREWIDKGIEPVPISVNISREYIHTFDVVGEMLHLVNKYDIPIKLLELEITETTDAEGVSDVVQKMKDAGFTMLMDDFGSGYSSLNMLKDMPVDVVKIDKEFFSDTMNTQKGRAVISTVVDLANNLDMDVISEGVETREQVEFLTEIHCAMVQGYYFAKPMPIADFEKLWYSDLEDIHRKKERAAAQQQARLDAHSAEHSGNAADKADSEQTEQGGKEAPAEAEDTSAEAKETEKNDGSGEPAVTTE